MSIKAVLFDLDGTLLPMDQEEFATGYFKLLAKKVMTLGYDPKQLVDAVWKGTGAMILNDGSVNNEDRFWEVFGNIFGKESLKDKASFDEFYRVEFQKAKELCGFNPKARDAVRAIKEMGFRTVLATNPIFPAVATESRIRWAGLEPSDFELYTTYENIGYCKPNLEYYKDILKRIDLSADECLMVGNDVGEDMVAEGIGIKVFLLSDCIINRNDKDISVYPNGSFDELMNYVKNLNN